MEWFGLGDLMRRVMWHATAERISWYVFFPLQIYFARDGHWGIAAVFVLATVLIVTFRDTVANMRTVSHFRALGYRQFCRDRKAAACLAALRDGRQIDRRPLVLFLRAFSTDRCLRARTQGTRDGYDVERLESRLIKGFAGWSTMVSLAGPENSDTGGEKWASMPTHITPNDPAFEAWAGLVFYERPGEIRVPDDEWHEAFTTLANAADLIVSLPFEVSIAEEGSATVRELLELQASGRIDRCLFIMPPEQSLLVSVSRDGASGSSGIRIRRATITDSTSLAVSTLWERTRDKLKKHHLPIPSFADVPDGATLFTLRDGSARHLRISAKGLSVPKLFLPQLGLDVNRVEARSGASPS